MGKKWKPVQCAYPACTNVFTPQREAQRFCSKTCRKAYNYDITRTSKKPRRRAIRSVENLFGRGIPESVQKPLKSYVKQRITDGNKGGVTLTKRCGIEVPTTTDITDDELSDIIRLAREQGSAGLKP